jgi:hypothetical protein
LYLNLVNLGDGKFVVAKIFALQTTGKEFAVLTGVEMMMAGDQSLKMVKHKSAHLSFGNDNIQCVL